MLTIFNRAELTVTYSLEQQALIRSALANKGIKYRFKIVNGTSGQTRARVGGFDRPCEYVFYVHKDELDAARAALVSKITR